MAAGQRPMQVVCVDDERGTLDMTEAMLERAEQPIDLTTFEEPGAVLDRLDEGEPTECIVSDYQMPRMDGLELLEAVREQHPDLPFILLTSKGSEEIASEAISKGVSDYVQKGGAGQYELLANRIAEQVDRYRTERQRERTEQRYRRLVEQSVVGIGLSQDGVLRYVNPKFADIFGYRPEELVGTEVTKVIAEEDHDRLLEAIEMRESGEVDSVHYVLTAVDSEGNRFDIEVNGSNVVYDGKPAVLGAVQPLEPRRTAIGDDEDVVPDALRTRLRVAAGRLAAAPQDGEDLQAAERAVRGALEMVEDGEAGSDASTDPENLSADLGECCRSTWARSELSERSTLDGPDDASVLADAEALVRLLEELWAAWATLEAPVAVTVAVGDGAFEIEMRTEGRAGKSMLQPPLVAQVAEAHGWDCYLAETDEGVRYSFENVVVDP